MVSVGEEVPLYPPPPCRTVWVEGPPEEIHLAVGEETTFVASLAAIYDSRLDVDAPGDIVDVRWEVVVPGSFRIAIVGLKGFPEGVEATFPEALSGFEAGRRAGRGGVIALRL